MLIRAEGLLHRLRDGGAHIEVSDNTLHITAPAGVLTSDLQNEVAAHKVHMLDVVTEAVELLNRRGARLIKQGDGVVIGIWRDADGREVRDALDVVGLGDAKVTHLDDPEACVPDRYRQYVPEYVAEIWARQGLLATPAERLEAERKARFLNRAFDTWEPRLVPAASRPPPSFTVCCAGSTGPEGVAGSTASSRSTPRNAVCRVLGRMCRVCVGFF